MQKNWLCGFVTLTYRPEKIPYLPKKYFKYSGVPYEKITVFNYEHINKLTRCIRNWLWREYKEKDAVRYLIVCEKGTEGTHRPHYHGVFIWKPIVDYKTMYLAINDAWRGTQNVIRQNHLKKKREDYGIISPYKSWEVRNKAATAKYVSKYVCKDIGLEKELKEIKKECLTRKNRNELRHYEAFHKQSLGFGRLENEELERAYERGVESAITQKLETLPEYNKNRLLTRPYKYYDLTKHKERTIKIYTKYFWDNKESIYLESEKKLTAKYEQLGSLEYWQRIRQKDEQKGSGETEAVEIVKKYGARELAKFEILYYGVNYWRCQEGKTNGEILIRRYNPIAWSEEPTINAAYYAKMTRAVERINDYIRMGAIPKEREQERKLRELKEFFKEY